MTHFLASLPIWLSALLMVGVTTVLAMSGSLLVRRNIGIDRLIVNNEVAGFKFATVGVIYAVLMAFAVIVVWEKFSEAQRAAVREAGSVATLYRLSGAFTPDSELAFRRDLAGYLVAAINADWPAMEQGESSHATHIALDKLYQQLIHRTPEYPQQGPTLIEMFRQLDEITHARRERLHLSLGIVPGVIWAALLIGAGLTVVFTFFFGTRNLAAQVLMTGVLSAMTSIGLLVIASIDHPFTGPVKITAHSLVDVLHDFGENETVLPEARDPEPAKSKQRPH